MNIGDMVTEEMTLVAVERITVLGFPNTVCKFVGERGDHYWFNTSRVAVVSIGIDNRAIITGTVKSIDVKDNMIVYMMKNPWVEEIESA